MENHSDSTHEIEQIENTIISNPNIKLSGDLPHGVTLHVRLGNEERIMDSDVKEADYTVAAPGKYWIEIDEELTKPEETIGNPGLSLIVKLFQGIIYAFQAFGDSGKWEKNIKAYVIKGRFEVELTDKLDIVLNYSPSEYHEEEQKWDYPSLQVTHSLRSEIELKENPLDFSDKLNEYISGFTMISGIASIFFGFISVKAAFSASPAVAITFGAMVAGIVILAIGVVKSQRKKCKRLYDAFISKKLPYKGATHLDNK